MKNLMNKIRKSNKGFTLVELIIVVAIIAVLSAVLVPQYIQYVEKSRIGVDESYISEVGHNLEILAASDADINGKGATVTFDADGDFAVTGTAATDVTAELDLLFPSANRTFKSNEYTGRTANFPAIELKTDGTVEYKNTKNTLG